MKLSSALILVLFASFHPYNNGEDVVAKMYKRYAGKWMKSFTFSQTTEMYRNDSLIKIATWYENILYPDKFRIDFGAKDSGNAAIFTKDSVYRFKNKMLTHTSPNDDDLTFMLGGMYFYSLDSVKLILAKSGYDLNKSYETKFNGIDVDVIGANNATDSSNQLWIDKDKLVVVKFISDDHGQKLKGIFKDHKQFGNSWSETACDFYVDGKLIQKEKYFDCKANVSINPKIFDYNHFISLQ